MRFQWLKDYQELDDQILYLKWNLNKSKLELNRWTSGDLAGVKLEQNSRASKLEENIQMVERELVLLENQKNELLKIIQSLKGIENTIIRMKYIEGMTLDQIAETDEFHYSISHIRKKHAEIRSKLEFLDDYERKKCDRRNKIEELDYYNERRRNQRQLSLF